MKLTLLLLTHFVFTAAFSQDARTHFVPDTTKPIQVVDVACGTCKFGLAGTDCLLAARIESKAYFIEGTKIDDHGDAHASQGFCKAIRRAEVQGAVMNEKFVVTYFKLLPVKP